MWEVLKPGLNFLEKKYFFLSIWFWKEMLYGQISKAS